MRSSHTNTFGSLEVGLAAVQPKLLVVCFCCSVYVVVYVCIIIISYTNTSAATSLVVCYNGCATTMIFLELNEF